MHNLWSNSFKKDSEVTQANIAKTCDTFLPFFILQVTEGNAGFTLQIAQLTDQLQKQLNTTLFDLQQSGARLYLGVAVTNKQSKGHSDTQAQTKLWQWRWQKHYAPFLYEIHNLQK